MKRFIISLALLVAAALVTTTPARAQEGPQCPVQGKWSLTWNNCPPTAQAAPAKPKRRAHRHAPAPQAFVLSPDYYPPPAAYPPSGSVGNNCPNGFVQFAHVWSLYSIAPHLQAQAQALIAAARARESQDARALPPYRPDAVSRTLGAQLRTGPWGPAPVNDGVHIRYLDPHSGQLVREVGVIRLNHGVGSIPLPGDPRHYVVEAIWPLYLISPTPSGGALRTRSFPNEPRGCRDHIHGLAP